MTTTITLRLARSSPNPSVRNFVSKSRADTPLNHGTNWRARCAIPQVAGARTRSSVQCSARVDSRLLGSARSSMQRARRLRLCKSRMPRKSEPTAVQFGRFANHLRRHSRPSAVRRWRALPRITAYWEVADYDNSHSFCSQPNGLFAHRRSPDCPVQLAVCTAKQRPVFVAGR